MKIGLMGLSPHLNLIFICLRRFPSNYKNADTKKAYKAYRKSKGERGAINSITTSHQDNKLANKALQTTGEVTVTNSSKAKQIEPECTELILPNSGSSALMTLPR